MLLEGNSNLIAKIESQVIAQRPAEFLHFHDSKVLVITQDTLALYKSLSSITDPLGNGLISLQTLPSGQLFSPPQGPWAIEHTAGFIGLSDGKALLILPIAIRLYKNKEDALRNREILVELPLT